MNASDIEKEMKAALCKGVLSSRIQERKVGKLKHESIWMRISRDSLRPAVKALSLHGEPHLAVISGTDLGEEVELLYHFCLGHGNPGKQFTLNLAVPLKKSDFKIPSISDLVPGAVFTEREKQEFFGVEIEGIPDNRRAFLADDLAKAHPWIRDDKETLKIARDIHGKGAKA